MKDTNFILNSANLRDFYKYRLLLIIFLIISGGSLILFLFRLRWMLIVALVAVYFSIRKAFRVEFRLSADTVQIKKTFMGFAYRKLCISYLKVYYFSNNGDIKFQGQNNTLIISLEKDGLKIQKIKLQDFICTKKEAEILISNLLPILKNSPKYSEIRKIDS